MSDKSKDKSANSQKVDTSRRNFMKFGGVAAAGATLGGLAVAGVQIGQSGQAYTGVADRTHKGQFFNRKPFQVEIPTGFKPVGPVERPHYTEFMHERTFSILPLMQSGRWTPEMGLEKLPGPVGDYYRKRPESFEIMMKALAAGARQNQEYYKEGGKNVRYAISSAYHAAHLHVMYPYDGNFAFGQISHPLSPVDTAPNPPEEWDFRKIWRKKPMEFKSPAHASELIKAVTHAFGATLVGICKFDPTFMFTNYMRGIKDDHLDSGIPNRGRNVWGTDVPKHWKSLIVFGVPMHWDTALSATAYSTSFDGYSRLFSICALLEHFIQELGYPSRPQMPPVNYELIMPPYGALAGLGELGRVGTLITPELGMNVRLAGMVTNIEFEYDKPIDFGVRKFCRKCKLCAESCPSGAITKSSEPDEVVRGFRRWHNDGEKCFLQWSSAATREPSGCRICVGVCPYSRKNTWIHNISREVDARDPTGLVSSGLLAMQKGFFHYPEAQDYKADWDGGKEYNYHNPPKWLRTEEYFKIEKSWEYGGNE